MIFKELISYEICYFFIESKLVKGFYYYKLVNPSNFNDCDHIFEEIKEKLVNKYGESTFDQNNKTIEPDLRKLLRKIGSAGFGHQTYEIWYTERTKIELILDYNKNIDTPPFTLVLMYTSRLHEDLFEKKRISDY